MLYKLLAVVSLPLLAFVALRSDEPEAVAKADAARLPELRILSVTPMERLALQVIEHRWSRLELHPDALPLANGQHERRVLTREDQQIVLSMDSIEQLLTRGMPMPSGLLRVALGGPYLFMKVDAHDGTIDFVADPDSDCILGVSRDPRTDSTGSLIPGAPPETTIYRPIRTPIQVNLRHSQAETGIGAATVFDDGRLVFSVDAAARESDPLVIDSYLVVADDAEGNLWLWFMR